MSQTPPTGAGPFPRDPDIPGGPASRGTPDTSADPDRQAARPQRAGTRKDPLRSSVTGRAWISVVALGVVLVLLIVFIAQNTDSVSVSFPAWKGHAPLAVALLIAAVAGLFVAAVAGTLRIWQLRRRVRRETKHRPAA